MQHLVFRYYINLYSIIFMRYFIIVLTLAVSACGFCFAHYCYAEVVLPELLKEPHWPILKFPKRSFYQKKQMHCSFKGKWFSSWMILASLWWSTRCIMKHKVQFSVLSVFCGLPMCLWLHFKYFTWFDIVTMHAWIQLIIALAYVLMYYMEI